MSGVTRREFLLSLAALPMVKLAIPPVVRGLTTGLAAPQGQTGEAQTEDASRPNILMIVFDAFSAHNISLYGYHRATTPNLSRLAERATVFHQHYAGGNYTTPGTSTLLTGTYPWTHRAAHHFGHVRAAVAPNNVFNLMPDDYYKVAYSHNPLALAVLTEFMGYIDYLPPRSALTLSDQLWSDVLFPHDYPVAVHAERVFAGQNRPSSAPFLRALQFFTMRAATRRNRRKYGEQFPRHVPNAPFDADFLLEDAVNWVTELTTTVSHPYFGYVHLIPPHAPYNTRADFVDIFKDDWTPPQKEDNPYFTEGAKPQEMIENRRQYDEYVAYVDAEFGRLFDQLERSGALENTYLIMTSDHGEMFERGYSGHGGLPLYDPVIHIPLMVWKPGQTQRVDITERTSAVDILPTLLHLTGQPIPDLCEGIVLPTFSDAARPADRSVFSVESKLNSAFTPITVATMTLYQDRYKLIQYTGYEQLPGGAPYYELFDLTNDPDELENLFTAKKTLGEELGTELAHRVDIANASLKRS